MIEGPGTYTMISWREPINVDITFAEPLWYIHKDGT